MPQTRECDYCGDDIEPGTGTMVVFNDGTTVHYCSSKCEKNADLGREPRDQEWTEAGQAQGGEAQAAPAEEAPATSEEEEAEATEAEAEAEEEAEEAESEEEAEEAESEEEAEAEEAEEETEE